MVVVVLFWVSLFTLVYAHVGYLTILLLVASLRRGDESEPTPPGAALPFVTMIISAYNEVEVIGQKIENALSLDYPRELLEIVVASDGSTDGTAEVVSTFEPHGVVLRHYNAREGKTALLNRVLPLARGQVIVFSDANSLYDRRALKALVHRFRDTTIGFVTGWTQYRSRGGDTSGPLRLYARIELLTKELESRLGSCIGADGAIFAIRKELYVPLNANDINDLVIPFSINERGYRGVLDRAALCFESDAGGNKGEFQRQARITGRTIGAIVSHRRLLNPLKFPLLSFEIISHKVCRFLVPLLLIALIVTNVLMAGEGRFFLIALCSQGLFYGLAGVASLMPRRSLVSRTAAAARTFLVVNAAVAVAWVRFLQGERYVTWSPTRR